MTDGIDERGRRMKRGGTPMLKAVMASIGNRWPLLRFLSLALYSAWILLTLTSDEAVSTLGGLAAWPLQGELYLSSSARKATSKRRPTSFATTHPHVAHFGHRSPCAHVGSQRR